ncbi:MAG: hypothetical protein IKA05_02550 [Clostridia bacterium]|nr:hypothetical protein [Clostridia bacterium]
MNMQGNEKRTNCKKDAILQTVKIVLFSLLALALAVLTVLELQPTALSELQIKTPFRVSSALIDVGQGAYALELNGEFVNESNETVEVDAIAVTVSNGKLTKRIEMEGFALPPRTSQEVTETWTGIHSYDRITRVEVTVNGEVDVLANTANPGVSGIAILYLIALAGVAILLVRACKIRYYIHQEARMLQNGARED